MGKINSRKFTFNFEGIEEPEEFSQLPPGTYRAVVKKVDARFSSSNCPLWNLMFQVVEPVAFKGGIFWDNIVFQDGKSASRAKHILRRMGYDCEGEEDLFSEDLIGKTVCVDLQRDVFEGKVRVRPTFRGYHYDSEDIELRVELPVQGKLPLLESDDSDEIDLDSVPF